MNLGAEPKKLAILGGVVVVGAILYFMNSTGDSTPAPTPRAASTAVPTFPVTAKSTDARARNAGRLVQEFRPILGPARPEEKIDPATIDPELKLDLLAKVQAVPPIEAGRNLFQFGTKPPPEKAPMPVLPANPPKIEAGKTAPPPPPSGPGRSGPSGPVAGGTPPAPPINLKYFGIEVRIGDDRKKAFLMDGDEPLIVEENQTVKQRYRIVHISAKSIVIEDIQAKSTQTLQIQELPPA